MHDAGYRQRRPRVHAKASYGRRQAERRRNGITRACCENRVRHHKVLVASAARLGGRDRRIPIQIDNAQSMGIVARGIGGERASRTDRKNAGMGRVPNRVVGGCQAHLGSGARNRQAAAVGKRNDRTESQRARVDRGSAGVCVVVGQGSAPLPVFVKELLPEITPESVSDVLTTLIDTLLPRAIPTEIDEEVTPESTVIPPLANVRLFPLTEKLFAANSIDWKVVPAVKLSCVAVRVVPENTRASPDTGAPFDQLAAVLQFASLPPPVQVRTVTDKSTLASKGSIAKRVDINCLRVRVRAPPWRRARSVEFVCQTAWKATP